MNEVFITELLCMVLLAALWKVGDFLLKRERRARQIMHDTRTVVDNRTWIG